MRLRGACSLASSTGWRPAWRPIPPGSKLVLLDFLEVIYIDSTALETVERYCENCRRAGVEVIVFGLGPQPRGLFARTGVDKTGLDHVSRRDGRRLIWPSGARFRRTADNAAGLGAFGRFARAISSTHRKIICRKTP